MQRGSQRDRPSAQNLSNSERRDTEVKLDRTQTINNKEAMKAALSVPKPKNRERQRIFISGVNSLVGHALFEQMRNDH